MFFKKRKGLLLGGLLSVVAIIIVALMVAVPTKNVSAESSGNLNFTLVTDDQGNDSYSVSILSAAKPTAEFVVVPEEYDGIPVTAVAMNGFMSSAKLKKVILPKSIKEIGNNAFMNCANLERISMLSVENIGMNAFAMCPQLSGLFFPSSVMSVGANVLRGNANKIYIQNSQAIVESNWQSTWSNYFTGATIYDAETENALHYREILDSEGGNVIGYELDACQAFLDEGNDFIIYDTFRADENSPYLPVLNICPEAFIPYSTANSVVFKIRPETASDSSFPHSINIRSYAFYCCVIPTISFELPVTFEHPHGLEYISEWMGISSIEGDDNGKSINVFTDASLESITLPSSMDIIPEGMFEKCAYLHEIKIYGETYTGKNVLPAVTTIGARAFASSPAIPNLTILATVKKVGENAFYEWGSGSKQTINIDFYEDELPNGWNSNWKNGIKTDNTSIIYKEVVIVNVNFQNGTSTTISVKPGESLPELSIPVRTGYTFKGVFANSDGTGKQFYTSEMKSYQLWSKGDPYVLFGHWEANEYRITYEVDLRGLNNPNPEKFKYDEEIELIPLKLKGYFFKWSQDKIPKYTSRDVEITGTWTPYTYQIKYKNLRSGTNNPNPTEYDYDQEVILKEATYGGYYVTFDITRIPVHTEGPVTVTLSYREKTIWECVNGGVYEIWTENQMSALRDMDTKAENFILMRYLYLDDWVPIPKFNGSIDLNNKGIYINNYAVPDKSDYGFIIENNGLILNGLFYPTFVGIGGNSSGLDTQTNTGVICATNNGTINNCTILTTRRETDIIINNYLTTFGTVCGVNNGTVTYCSNTALVTSYCIRTGGIVGYNSENAKISYCENSGRFDLYAYDGVTLCLGGIVATTGASSTVQSCSNYGYLYFAGYTSTNYTATIYMAHIAGSASKSANISENTNIGSGWVQANPSILQYVRGSIVGTQDVATYYDDSSSGGGTCVSAGTLITLADGRQVPVESLTGSEMLLVWNMETGCFDVAPILFIDKDPEKVYEVINLYFSDGTNVKVITEHAFWDFDLNEYVFLRSDAAKYIGHWFNKQLLDSNGNLTWTRVQLTNVVIADEYTSAWSPVTYGHLCYYVNGMLSMPGATEGLINIFDVDANTMTYNSITYEADIQTYGLFTYEEFCELIAVPEEVFNAFNGQYLKVAIGKGLIDLDTLNMLFERYKDFFSEM